MDVRARKRHLRFGIVLIRGFRLTSASVVLDALEMASSAIGEQDHISWDILNSSGTSVRSSCSARILATEVPGKSAFYDYFFLVGGLPRDEKYLHERMKQLARNVAEQGGTVVGIGGGTDVMANMGLLNGRKCCVSWIDRDKNAVWDYKDIQPVEDQLFVEDGNMITCVGGIAALDVTLWIIRQHFGDTLYESLWRRMMGHRPRQATTPQPRPSVLPNDVEPLALRIMSLMESHLTMPLKHTDIAHRIGISPRKLSQVVQDAVNMSPSRAYLLIRLHHAARALLESQDKLSDISDCYGFADAAHFSRCFSQAFATTPFAFRKSGRTGQANAILAAGPF